MYLKFYILLLSFVTRYHGYYFTICQERKYLSNHIFVRLCHESASIGCYNQLEFIH